MISTVTSSTLDHPDDHKLINAPTFRSPVSAWHVPRVTIALESPLRSSHRRAHFSVVMCSSALGFVFSLYSNQSHPQGSDPTNNNASAPNQGSPSINFARFHSGFGSVSLSDRLHPQASSVRLRLHIVFVLFHRLQLLSFWSRYLFALGPL